jgi:hypothetical protein
LFHAFWLTFIYDLHFKKTSVIGAYFSGKLKEGLVWEALRDRVSHIFDWTYLRHYQNYFILPGIIYWSVVILLFLNPFRIAIKQFIVLAASLAITVAYWYFKDFFSRKMETHEPGLRILTLVKLLAAFLIYSSIVGITRYYDLGREFLVVAAFVTTFLLVYQALFQHKLLNLFIYAWIIALCILMSLLSYFIYVYWDSNYLTAGLVMLAVYNTAWGLLHHYLEKTLTKKLAFEYLIVMVAALSLLLASHNFGTRIHSI